MQGSTPQHYTVADFVKWNDDNELILNPDFQRGAVWPSHAKTYLIDSLLRGYPIPKLLIRTVVDRSTRRTIRDVVDGQQRLRAIFSFINDEFVLGQKAGEFQGLRYDDLEPETQDSLLSYKLTCEQLLNASDEDVLEVFGRINSYAVPVNEPELRNAQFNNYFSASVKQTAKDLADVWSLGVLSERDRVRMSDQSLVAEMFGIVQSGLNEGSEKDITRLYNRFKEAESELVSGTLEMVTSYSRLAAEILEPLGGEPIVKKPHFVLIFSALLALDGCLPAGKVDTKVPEGWVRAGDQVVLDSFSALNDALLGEEFATTPDLRKFRDARSTTQRVKSRQARFDVILKALTGNATLA